MKHFFFTLLLFASVANSEASLSKKSCYKVEGMTCAACTTTTKASIKKLDGILDVKVSLDAKSATVIFDSSKTTETKIKERIDFIGYKAESVTCTD
ncbi:MAG: heavy-metal-associated domain-containing protein [Pseudomonadota bacterium]|nr:heavy-metal-associated domain-containing protein [Pseudomonadota bacterium]